MLILNNNLRFSFCALLQLEILILIDLQEFLTLKLTTNSSLVSFWAT